MEEAEGASRVFQFTPEICPDFPACLLSAFRLPSLL